MKREARTDRFAGSELSVVIISLFATKETVQKCNWREGESLLFRDSGVLDQSQKAS